MGDQTIEQLGDRMVLATREVEDLPRPGILGEPGKGRDGVVHMHEITAGGEIADREDGLGAALDRDQLLRETGQSEARGLAGPDQVERTHDGGTRGERLPLGGGLGQRIGRTRRHRAVLGIGCASSGTRP